MAEKPRQRRDTREETGEERQERIKREQHRPEQDEGYDEAVERPGTAHDDGVPPDQRPRREL